MSRAYKYCATRRLEDRREKIGGGAATCIPLLGANDCRWTRLCVVFLARRNLTTLACCSAFLVIVDDDLAGVEYKSNDDEQRDLTPSVERSNVVDDERPTTRVGLGRVKIGPTAACEVASQVNLPERAFSPVFRVQGKGRGGARTPVSGGGGSIPKSLLKSAARRDDENVTLGEKAPGELSNDNNVRLRSTYKRNHENHSSGRTCSVAASRS